MKTVRPFREFWTQASRRLAALLWVVALLTPLSIADPAVASDVRWHNAGGFSFSDQLGGFRILSVTGSGSKGDPFIIDQEFSGPGPGTIAIRNQDPSDSTSSFMQIFIVTRVKNVATGTWIGFDIELQEELRIPSDYWDGLSFNQTQRADKKGFRSSRFRNGERIAEPHDRVRFLDGHVNVGTNVEFRFVITDVTPSAEFYLLQEPVMLYSYREAPGARIETAYLPGRRVNS